MKDKEFSTTVSPDITGPKRYEQLADLIRFYKPETLVEVGTWNGGRAIEMALAAFTNTDEFTYIGYDLFENCTEQLDKHELNSKPHNSLKAVKNRLTEFQQKISLKGKAFHFTLTKGDTNNTLKLAVYDPDLGPQLADFAFIDGGHSEGTVNSDYNSLKSVPVVVFDDFVSKDENGNTPGESFLGVNKIIEKSTKRKWVLPSGDRISEGGITHLAVILFNDQLEDIPSYIVKAGNRDLMYGDPSNTSSVVALKQLMGTLSTFQLAAGLSNRLRSIERKLVSDLGETVRGGPFAGMIYTPLLTSSSCIVPKLLGCYEQELHSTIRTAGQCNFDAIINIGCTDGYYAVGMARSMPTIDVYAFDLDELAREHCQALVECNGVSDRVHIGESISPGGFDIYRDQRVLVICNGKGRDVVTLDPIKAQALLGFDLIVEMNSSRTETINNFTTRFSATHQVDVIQPGVRIPESFPELSSLSLLDKILAVHERFELTPWVSLRALPRSS